MSFVFCIRVVTYITPSLPYGCISSQVSFLMSLFLNAVRQENRKARFNAGVEHGVDAKRITSSCERCWNYQAYLLSLLTPQLCLSPVGRRDKYCGCAALSRSQECGNDRGVCQDFRCSETCFDGLHHIEEITLTQPYSCRTVGMKCSSSPFPFLLVLFAVTDRTNPPNAPLYLLILKNNSKFLVSSLLSLRQAISYN